MFRDPISVGGSTVGLHVYAKDVDAIHRRAIAAGAKELQPPTEMFYGARTAMLQDPYGHIWVFLKHTQDMTPAQIQREGEKLLKDNS